jgi:hypothetical protein
VSIKIMTWAFEQKIPGNIKIVLLALADNANDEGYCWPSQETIARKASVSVRNLRRLLTQLEERELISISRRNDRDGHRASNGYYVGQALPDNLAGGPTGQIDTAYRPLMSPQEPSLEPPKSNNAGEAEWERFWLAYPRKVGKDAARKAWKSALKRASVTEILDGLERLLPSLKAREPQYVPHPSTWLNAGSWTDEPDAPSSTRPGQQQRPKIDPQREWEYR